MTGQRLRKFLALVIGQRAACRSILSLMLLVLIIMGLPALSGAQQACLPNGDVDRNGSVTAADALLAFQQALGLAQLTACQRDIADVFPQPASPDGSITASDALCIFQKALSLPSCLDSASSTNQPPVADAGLEQVVFANEVVTLAGSGSDADGTIVRYRWEQISGPTVVLSGADTPNVSFTAPEVSTNETLTFRLTVTDNQGATGSDNVRVMVHRVNQPPVANAGFDQTVDENTVVFLAGSGTDSDGTIVRYGWTQISSTSVTLTGSETRNTGFTAPETESPVTLTFRFTVTDDEGAIASDDVVVVILPTERLMVSVSGTVRDHATGEVIPQAAVRVTQYNNGIPRDLGTTNTDDNGNYEIQVRANSGRVNVNVDAEHYAPQSSIVNVTQDTDSASADLASLPVDVVHDFRAADDAEIRNQDHVLVSVPGGSLVTKNGGEPGEVTAMVTVLDASSDPSVMPGDFLALNEATGASEPIESFGAMNVRFVDENGEPLNLKSGQEASLSIPLAQAKAPGDAPATIPMFYWSDELGHWVEEGSARLEQVSPGKWAYVGGVNHFTTWNADKRYESIWIRGCVVDSDGNPAFARVTATGRDYIGNSSVSTDSNGWFEVQARPNSEVLLVARRGNQSDEGALTTGNESIELDQCTVLEENGSQAAVHHAAWICLPVLADYGTGDREEFISWDTPLTFPPTYTYHHPTLGVRSTPASCDICAHDDPYDPLYIEKETCIRQHISGTRMANSSPDQMSHLWRFDPPLSAVCTLDVQQGPWPFGRCDWGCDWSPNEQLQSFEWSCE